jgi:hypothetical protein
MIARGWRCGTRPRAATAVAAVVIERKDRRVSMALPGSVVVQMIP